MEKEGDTVRFRVVFDDCSLLSKSQISDGFSRCWLLLKPGIATFADLASHLRETFAFRERLVLYIDDFVLPPFESTRIIKDNDIIRVKLKDVKLKDSYRHCDDQKTLEDSQIAKANFWGFSNSVIVDDETYQENSEQIVKNEQEKLVSHTDNAVHAGNSSYDNVMMKQKRKKRLKANIAETQVIGAEDVHIDELQLDQMNHHGCDSKLHIADDVTMELGHISGERSKVSEHGIKEKSGGNGDNHCNKKSNGSSDANGAWFDRKPEGSARGKAVPAKQRIDMDRLFLLTRQPQDGDILAYRYVEPLSEFLELSSPQVGRVSAFSHESKEICLMPVHEFDVFTGENPTRVTLQQRSSLHKEDGSLVINFSQLFDVRLLKGHDSRDLTEKNDDGWTKSTPMERKGSTSRPRGASPSENFFWKTYRF